MAINHTQVVQYLRHQLSTNPDDLRKQTNWIGIERARFLKLCNARRKFLTNVRSGDLPIGEVMKERQHKQSAQCSFCTEEEDLIHIIVCCSTQVSSNGMNFCWFEKEKKPKQEQNQSFTHSLQKSLKHGYQSLFRQASLFLWLFKPQIYYKTLKIPVGVDCY